MASTAGDGARLHLAAVAAGMDLPDVAGGMRDRRHHVEAVRGGIRRRARQPPAEPGGEFRRPVPLAEDDVLAAEDRDLGRGGEALGEIGREAAGEALRRARGELGKALPLRRGAGAGDRMVGVLADDHVARITHQQHGPAGGKPRQGMARHGAEAAVAVAARVEQPRRLRPVERGGDAAGEHLVLEREEDQPGLRREHAEDVVHQRRARPGEGEGEDRGGMGDGRRQARQHLPPRRGGEGESQRGRHAPDPRAAAPAEQGGLERPPSCATDRALPPRGARCGGRGGTGRHAGFRFRWRKPWGFESLRPHQGAAGFYSSLWMDVPRCRSPSSRMTG